LVVKVLDEGSPDNEHLCLGLKRLLLLEGTLGGHVVFAGEVAGLRQGIIDNVINVHVVGFLHL